MWYHSLQHFGNPLSPRRQKGTPVPNVHAHSPLRHDSRASDLVESPSRRPDPPGTTKSRPQPVLESLFDDSKQYQSNLVASIYNEFGDVYQRHQAEMLRESGNSSYHDTSMPDYSRPLSPNSVPSVQMVDYSRPPSDTASETLEPTFSVQIHPHKGRIPSWFKARQTSSGNGEYVHHTGNVDMGSRVEALNESQEGGLEKGIEHGIVTPANSRVQSATHTLSTLTRPSAAKEARDASYNGKQRVNSITSRETPVEGARNDPKVGSSGKPEEGNDDCSSSILTRSPTNEVKSKKEGRGSNMGLNIHSKHSQNSSRATSGQRRPDENNIGSQDNTPSGDPKRRRLGDAPGVENMSTSQDVRMVAFEKGLESIPSTVKGRLVARHALQSSSGNSVRN